MLKVQIAVLGVLKYMGVMKSCNCQVCNHEAGCLWSFCWFCHFQGGDIIMFKMVPSKPDMMTSSSRSV